MRMKRVMWAVVGTPDNQGVFSNSQIGQGFENAANIIVVLHHLGGGIGLRGRIPEIRMGAPKMISLTPEIEEERLVGFGTTFDEVDRRRTILEITPEGWQRFDRLSKIQPEVNNIHFECLTSEKFDQMRETMPQLVKSTDRALSLLRHRISELESSS